jgi:hypothetical protein
VARLTTGDTEKLIVQNSLSLFQGFCLYFVLKIIDWKTSSAFGNEYAIQLAAYAKLYEEVHEKKVDRALIVCLLS